MPPTKLPLIRPLNTNTNELVTRSAYSQFWNLTYDDQDNVRSRPGHTSWLDLATGWPAYGYWWNSQRKLVVLSNGTLHLIDQYGAYTTAATTLQKSRACYFTDDGDRLFMATNGQIAQYTVGGSVSYLSDPNAPTQVTTPLMFDGYLLANELGSNRVHFGEYVDPAPYTGQPYAWGGGYGGFFSAETSSDNVIAIMSAWRQVVVFGENTIEFWTNDGATPFSRSGSVITNHGILTPGAATLAVDSIYALTQRRRIIRIDNGQIADITTGIAQELCDLADVSNVESSYVQVGIDEFVFFNFPSAGVSFVFDIGKQVWMKWGVWNATTSLFETNLCSSYIHAPAWNRWLGLTRLGKIMELSEDVATDDGSPMRSVIRTGFFDAETPLRKVAVRDTIMARRGIGTYDPENPINTNYPCFLTLRYRNDDQMAWVDRELDLGKPGEYFQKIACNMMGSYYQRQYEIEYTDRAPLTIRDFYTEIETSEV